MGALLLLIAVLYGRSVKYDGKGDRSEIGVLWPKLVIKQISILRLSNSEFSHSSAQGAGIKFQDPGCAISSFNFPLAFLENPHNIIPLNIFKTRFMTFCQIFSQRCHKLFRQLQPVVPGVDHRAFDHIFQFADIAGPGMLL